MIWSLAALVLGFIIDLIVGDPQGFPHPVILIGKLISLLDKGFRKIFPKTKAGERTAGGFIWVATVILSAGIPFGILFICYWLTPWLGFAIESIMCWQILATKSLKTESMKVYKALETGDIEASRYAVSMIVGRDTSRLDDAGVTRAAVETVAENTSDGIIAPLIFLIIGGAPLGFFYKAINTMDSMLGYTDPPYTHIGFLPAKIDDVANFIPARISALIMLLGGAVLKLNVKNGWKIFKRDRYNHASPNSAQTESVCAGLLGLRLAGDAWYHGVLHKKKYIGDELRPIEHEDIPRSCRLLYATAILSLIIFGAIKFAVLVLINGGIFF
ncbi:MAG: cobalamin biosynthesis protein CobD [Parasporobacterium sp.]|nr:cobalamin biosynthesis protein CobD [Parasporobacterium sp.]